MFVGYLKLKVVFHDKHTYLFCYTQYLSALQSFERTLVPCSSPHNFDESLNKLFNGLFCDGQSREPI